MSELIRIHLAKDSPMATLVALHRREPQQNWSASLSALFDHVGATTVIPVYSLTNEEIARDEYGFARDFVLVLKESADLSWALKELQASTLVERARPVSMKQAYPKQG